MNVNIGLDDSSRGGVARILDRLLADEFVLYIKTRRFHWNVVGPHFAELHRLFESQYEQLDDIVDEVAERARSLGGTAAGSLREFLELTRLAENAGDNPAAERMIAALLADHESLIRSLRADLETASDQYRDAGTGDFLTGLLERHEKMAWMLRAHLA
jgi:starvation-inducible DNA-binding protein